MTGEAWVVLAGVLIARGGSGAVAVIGSGRATCNDKTQQAVATAEAVRPRCESSSRLLSKYFKNTASVGPSRFP